MLQLLQNGGIVDAFDYSTLLDDLAESLGILAQYNGPKWSAKWTATNPPGPRPWFWKALEVRDCLLKNDRNQTRATFDTISPAPISSVTYYQLWHQVRIENPKATASGLSAYGRWQTWDEDAKLFIESMSARLNDRMTDLDRRPGS